MLVCLFVSFLYHKSNAQKSEKSQFSLDVEATRVFVGRYLLPLCVMRVTVSQGRQDGLCVS